MSVLILRFMQNITQGSGEKSVLLLAVVLGILGIKGLPASAQVVAQPSVPSSESSVGITLSSGLEDGVTDENDAMAQITSVSQLTDVRPTDWAFQSLQSLVERYGCIVGYPDKTFRGNRAISRYEFAAGLNACMDRINELIGAGTADLVKQDDLVTLKKMQEEFAAELATLRGRVDALEARTTTLEKQQFSTTTKLFGQVVLGLQGRSKNNFSQFLDRNTDENTNVNLTSNTQLTLLTQLGPRSLLLTGLQAGNGGTGTQPELTNYTRLGYQGDTGNAVQLSDVTYRQLVGNNFAFIAGAVGVNPINVFRGVNRVQGSGSGSLSAFAQRNPIIGIGGGRTGVGFDWQIAPAMSLQGVYATNNGENPQNGLFGGENGTTTAGLQFVATPLRGLDVSLQYLNSYSPSGTLGTGVGDDQVAVLGANFRAPIQTNAFGATVEWRPARGLTLGGWFGYTTSDLLGSSGSVETVNWMAFVNLPDLGGPGNMASLYVGQPPRITSSNLPVGSNIPSFINFNPNNTFAGPGDQPSTTTHVEALYRWRVSDNISITPGVIFVFNPGQNSGNDTITIGAIRTTLTF